MKTWLLWQAPCALWRQGALLCGLLCCLFLPVWPAPGHAQPGPDTDAWPVVQQGSAVVLIRHAYAPGVGDPPNFKLGDCSTQRVLNEEGRQQARDIGQAFRNRGVNVTRVLSSQWCRAYDTANLAFPGHVTEEPVFNSFFQGRGSRSDQTARALDIIRGWKGPGVLVVFTHQVNITGLTDIFPASGQGVVVRADGATQGLTVLGTLRW